LVADYKHFIGPITASEVNYKMKELEKGITQVTKYIKHLVQYPQIDTFCIQDYSIVGLIITHKLLSIPTPKDNIVPIVDMESFSLEVTNVIRENKHLGNLVQKMQANFTKKADVEFSDFESEIRVSDWLIKRMQYRIS
jgi:hypothetical protein